MRYRSWLWILTFVRMTDEEMTEGGIGDYRPFPHSRATV